MTAIPIWRIRSAKPEDADALALIGGATFLESYAGIVHGGGIVAHSLKYHSAEFYRDYFQHGAQAWLAEIEPGAAPVGFALLCSPELEIAEEGDIELRRIYLLSRFQGTVMATALMQNVLRAAAGHKRLLLSVKNDNQRAIAFYHKHGFEEIGSRRFDIDGHLYDHSVLARTLTDSASPAPAL